MKHYRVAQRWAGWFGGYGNDGDLTLWFNSRTEGGWELRTMEIETRWWLLCVPRKKIIAVFERTE